MIDDLRSSYREGVHAVSMWSAFGAHLVSRQVWECHRVRSLSLSTYPQSSEKEIAWLARQIARASNSW